MWTGLDVTYICFITSAGLNRYTMFAPNDAAIDALPSGVQHNILTDSAYAAGKVSHWNLWFQPHDLATIFTGNIA